MLRREERRSPRPRRPDHERYGCFNNILDFLMLDIVLNALFEFGCSGCLSMAVAVCVAAAFAAHGLGHILHQNTLAFNWRLARRF